MPGGANFCAECGAQVSPAAPDARDEGELRQITAVFCDLVGSTELSTRLDAEEFGEVVRGYHQHTVEVVARYGGQIASYQGDGVLIHFGWPEAHDDDAERAVRCALDVAQDSDLPVRVGIHTGPVVVGLAHGDTMALGETMNLAARLQGVAEPGSVAISEATLRLVRGIFVIEDLGEHRLKGLAEPVHAYRAVQPSGVRSRLDAAADSLTPFVGRDAELGVLLDRWARTRDRGGQAVLVSGDAGVGKSRLVYELRERLADEAHSWLECRCSSYTQHSAFRPAIELVEQGLAFQPDESPAERIAKIESGLALIGLDEPEDTPLVAQLLSIQGAPDLAMGPDLQRRRTIEVLTRWVLALAELQPVLLFVEDLHWCDHSSLELFTQLLARGAQSPLMLVATARPEFEAAWLGRQSLTALALNPLSEGETREMLTLLAPGRELPDPVLERVLAETDGIPLYAEEMGRMVLDMELVAPVDELEIPTTLQDSLMARLDRLSAAKRVAQRAAAIGREFDFRLLEEVAGLDREVLRHGLARLVEDDLVFQRGEPPDATYTFKHALIQDAAYRSLLKRTRRELHDRIAAGLERRDTRERPVPAEVVARHYELAGRVEEAVGHYRRGAEEAVRHSGHREAIEHLRRAIRLLEELPDDAHRQSLEVDLQVALGSSVMAIGGYADPDVEAAYDRARVLCEGLGDGVQVAYTLIGLAIFYFNQGQIDRGAEFAGRALEIADREGEDGLQLLAHVQLAVPRFYGGRFADALDHAEAAAALYDRERHGRLAFRYGTDQGVAAHCFAASALLQLVGPEPALARLDVAERLAQELGQPFNLVYALCFRAAITSTIGDREAQEEAAARVVAIAEEQEFPFFAGMGRMFWAGARALRSGDPSALDDYLRGSALAAGTGTRGGAPLFISLLAETQGALGSPADALATVEAGLSLAAETGQPYWDADLLRVRGELLADTEAQRAESDLRRAMDIARAQGSRWFELRAERSLAALRGGAAQAGAKPSVG